MPLYRPVRPSLQRRKPVSNVHDLRDQPPVWHDLETNPPAACNDLYCGEAGLCATDASEREGCACEADSLARLTDKPNVASTGSDRQVTCVDAEFNLMPSVFDEGPSPCEDWTCGDGGSCVVLNGSPTCACAEGYAGDTCETDVDECATDNGGCGDPVFYACGDNPGSAPTCTDIDECATNHGG